MGRTHVRALAPAADAVRGLSSIAFPAPRGAGPFTAWARGAAGARRRIRRTPHPSARAAERHARGRRGAARLLADNNARGADYCGGGYDERKCAVYREDWTDALEGKSAILNKHRIANLRARLGVDAEMRGVASTLRDGLPELAKEISDAERKLAALKRKRDEITTAIREAEGMS